MKKLLAVTGILLIAVMVSTIGLAAAQEQPYTPTMTITSICKDKIVIWVINTREEEISDFSGTNVKLCTVVCTVTASYNGEDHIVRPLLIIPTKDKLTIIFLSCAFPNVPLGDDGQSFCNSWVTGTLRNGDTFLAAGPGFSFKRQ